jgi:hypothetical protein
MKTQKGHTSQRVVPQLTAERKLRKDPSIHFCLSKGPQIGRKENGGQLFAREKIKCVPMQRSSNVTTRGAQRRPALE